MPECISVTRRHFPDMAHVGDITQLHGETLPPVDIITFGSPCQGLSLTGLRRGLADERSGLFMEAMIQNFKKEKFYTVELDMETFRAVSGRYSSKTDAEKLRTACLGKSVIVQSISKKEKIEYPPRLYDLTTLQREANRLFDYTAQETLDYLQSLYEKRLATYPRTDSRYLTEDMEAGLPLLCSTVAETLPFMAGQPLTMNTAQPYFLLPVHQGE